MASQMIDNSANCSTLRLSRLTKSSALLILPCRNLYSIIIVCFSGCFQDLLQPCHCANAEYLFQQDKFYDMSYDTGDKSVQCGRKVDVFKLWLLWQAHGSTGLERRIDHVFAMAT